MEIKTRYALILVLQMETVFLLSLLITCVYSKALNTHRNGWKPGHKKHRYNTDIPLDPTLKKRDHHHIPNIDECCPSVTQIIQPLGGVSKDGRIFELYRDQNSTQSFYQTACRKGIKGHPCRYLDANRHVASMCVQRYTYTYALVREFDTDIPWRLDYIRLRSGCSCEVQVRERFYGKRRKRPSLL